jgi:SAM-dependent methyltransferase
MIRFLDTTVPPPAQPEGDGNEDHPMRAVTRQVAFEDGWSPDRAAKVAALFDGLAPDWHLRSTPERLVSLDDALARGDVPGGRALEPGSGTGIATPRLAAHFDQVVSLDLAAEMLRRAPAVTPRVQADAATLPVRSESVDAVVLVNALLFPAEVDRVLARDGVVVWVNTVGDRTPIHLPAGDVAAALPGEWEGVAASAGPGTWCVLRRAGVP